jgi:hypothetical protein
MVAGAMITKLVVRRDIVEVELQGAETTTNEDGNVLNHDLSAAQGFAKQIATHMGWARTGQRYDEIPDRDLSLDALREEALT